MSMDTKIHVRLGSHLSKLFVIQFGCDDVYSSYPRMQVVDEVDSDDCTIMCLAVCDLSNAFEQWLLDLSWCFAERGAQAFTAAAAAAAAAGPKITGIIDFDVPLRQ